MPKRILIPVGKGALTTIVFLVVVEAALRLVYAARNAVVTAVPLPYAIGDVYGPLPPWTERLQILRPDPALIWRNEPSARRTYVDIYSPIWREADRLALLRRFLPWLPREFRSNPVWHVRLNRDGFRADEFNVEKKSGVTRIAAVGDSWTFGMNVDEDRNYPGRLAALLATSGRAFDIQNFGVLGYSSFQGRRLFDRVLAYHPDIVLIGFGMNDSEMAGYRDKDMVDDGPPALKGPAPQRWSGPTWRARAAAWMPASEVFNLLKYLALVLRFRPVSIGVYMDGQARNTASAEVNYAEMEPWTRVSPVDYEANLHAMIGRARDAGARAILLDNELWGESPYRPVLVRVASDAHVPLVDSFALIARERTRIEANLERRLALAPPADVTPQAAADPGARVSIVFRVDHGAYAVRGRMSIVGTDPALGSLVPNTVAMYDDGTHGDERAGDGVWSCTATLARGERVYYMYTNGGRAGQWEGLDVPHVREYVAPSSGPAMAYAPVETFGTIYMQADNWHTDARGYDLIARALVPLVLDGATAAAERPDRRAKASDERGSRR